ncbi:MAG TPA: hypothetical protein VGJ20_11835 [Xanthobacteraceae bacterium]|jgi:hypothetical protein
MEFGIRFFPDDKRGKVGCRSSAQPLTVTILSDGTRQNIMA